ncbi:MAG: ribosomal L7Ae/L30e/S12e/Gadd45 family protein [Clostridia bacterium]|nr:ribosomal L7Ae/L30e/S12e/Gadd45 family protein [Clostridia bacterium]
MHNFIKDVFKIDNAICGIKQVRKALKGGAVKTLYLASDAEKRLIAPIVALSESLYIPVVWVSSMRTLGKMCGIDVGCAAAAVRNA